MGHSVTPPSRIIVVLKLPEYEVPVLVVRARLIVERVGVSPWFPAPEPPLAIVEQRIDDLAKAESETLTRRGDAVSVRNDKRLALVMLLEQMRSYVQRVANANPEQAATIIGSAGMYLKNVRGPAPRVFHAKQRGSTEVDLIFPSAGDRAAYECQLSLDAGKTWLPLPDPVTTKTTVPVRDLRPGSTVHLRYRATVKGVTRDWSQPISMIVG